MGGGDGGVSESVRLLRDDGVGAAEGLALDEALMASYHDGAPPQPPTLRLYTYASHAVLIGRSQDLVAEVDLDACRDASVGLSRRPTGGGAIVMGRDQLGLAVVDRARPGERPRETLERLGGALCDALSALGVPGQLRGKNDIEVAGRKVAGLGLYADGRGGILFHASLLAGLDIPFMLSVLRVPAAKLASKGIALVADRIVTVSELLDAPLSGADLAPEVAAGLARALGKSLVPGEPSTEELALASRLVATRYAAESWLFARSLRQERSVGVTAATPLGTMRVELALRGDVVKSALVTGDWLELPAAAVAIEEALRWQRLDRDRLAERLAGALGRSSHGDSSLVRPDVLAALLCDAARNRRSTFPDRRGSCYFPEVATA